MYFDLSFLCVSFFINTKRFWNNNYPLKKYLLYFFIFSLFFIISVCFPGVFFFHCFLVRDGYVFFLFFNFLQIFLKKRALFQVVFFLFFVFLFYFLVVFFAVENPFSKTWKYLFSAFLSYKRLFLPIFFWWKFFFRIMFLLIVFVTWVFESLLIVFLLSAKKILT